MGFCWFRRPPYTLMRRLIVDNQKNYKWLGIVSGLGHLNMNQIKTFFKVTDNVVLDVLGQDVLKFDTAKLYKYFVDCKDNHKAWQSFEIFLYGSFMELIRLYCAETTEVPSVLGFYIGK